MARQAVILYRIRDYRGLSYDVREERDTPHGWPVLIGWPSDIERGRGCGGPGVIITDQLKAYLETMRYDFGLISLPISGTSIRKLRRILGHHRYRDRPLWWAQRQSDLMSMTLEQFCAAHGCSIGAASQARKKYREKNGRDQTKIMQTGKPKFPKTEKIEVRFENALLERIPEQGRDRWINDACREKLDRPPPAAILGKKGGSVVSEAKAEAARENGKKGGRPQKPAV
jgi:hypothetical protein